MRGAKNSARLGRDLVAHALHRYGHELADTALKQAAETLGKHDEEELFVAVGEGSIKASAVAVAAFPGPRRESPQGREAAGRWSWRRPSSMCAAAI